MSLPNGVDVSQLVQHPVLAALPPFFLRASERYQVISMVKLNISKSILDCRHHFNITECVIVDFDCVPIVERNIFTVYSILQKMYKTFFK